MEFVLIVVSKMFSHNYNVVSSFVYLNSIKAKKEKKKFGYIKKVFYLCR